MPDVDRSAATDGWSMWAGRNAAGEFVDFGSRLQARLRGHEPQQVLLTESHDGPYWGWVPAALAGESKPGIPRHVYRRRVLFEICFDAVPEDMQAAGKGRVVRLTAHAHC